MAAAELSRDIIDHSIILDAVTAALNRLDHDVAAHLQDRDRQQHAYLVRENERLSAQIETLQREQATLRDQLSRSLAVNQTDPADIRSENGNVNAARQPSAAIAGLGGRKDARQPLGELSANAATPQRHAADMEKARTESPADRAARFAAKHSQMVVLLRKAKDNEQRWRAYAEMLEGQLGYRVGSGAVIRRPSAMSPQARRRSPSDTLPGPNRPQPDVVVAVEDVREQSPRLLPGPAAPASDASSTTLRADRTRLHHHAPSPVLDEEAATPEPGVTEDETDDAKAAELPPRPVRDAAAEVRRAIVVKQEPSSDDGPVFLTARPVKKRRRPDGDRTDSAAILRLKTEDGSSDPVNVGEVVDRSTQESLDLDDSSRPEMPTPKKRRSLPPARNDDMKTSGTTGAHTEQFVPSQGPPFIIRPLGDLLDAPPSARNNRKPAMLPPAATRHDYVTRRGFASHGEDGDDSSERGVASSLVPMAKAAVTPKPKPQQHHHTPTVTSEENQRAPQRGHDKACGNRGPLRKLPLASLRLDDFKPNPKATDGVYHVYNDVVRGKAERANLVGCTDPNCPGGKNWRALAESELKMDGPSLVGTPDSVRLMEQFMGDDAYKLGQMKRPEKEAVWLDAKTWQLANKYGRCRHRFPRPPTPEQYWNTDFPSTQDRARDKAEGERMERAMIEQRYREAMRNGGRWLFKDE